MPRDHGLKLDIDTVCNQLLEADGAYAIVRPQAVIILCREGLHLCSAIDVLNTSKLTCVQWPHWEAKDLSEDSASPQIVSEPCDV